MRQQLTPCAVRRGEPASTRIAYDRRAWHYSPPSSSSAPAGADAPGHLTDRPDELYDEVASFVATLPGAPVEQHYRRLFEWLCVRFARDGWLERSGGSLEMLPVLIARFPDARFVHLYHDGRDTALSMSRHHLFRIRVILEQLLHWLGREMFMNGAPPAEVERRVPPAWRELVPWAFDVEAYRWLDLPIEVFGARWSAQIIAGDDPLRGLPSDRVLKLKFESILQQRRDELCRLADFIGPGLADEDWISFAAALCRDKPPAWPALPQDAQARLQEACVPGMKRLGYI